MSSRGLTLIELLIVLALVAILSSISVVSWARMQAGLAVGAAARQVAAELTLTRLRAISSRASHRVVFAEGGPTYQLERANGSAYTRVNAPVVLPGGVRIVTCTAPDAAVSFRPRGNAGSFGTITLGNVQGDTRQVVVDIAGHVRVQ